MCLSNEGRSPQFIPAIAREVYDVSGAGDTVIATLTLGVAAGMSFPDAARMANIAAGVVVGKLDIPPINLLELSGRRGEQRRHLRNGEHQDPLSGCGGGAGAGLGGRQRKDHFYKRMLRFTASGTHSSSQRGQAMWSAVDRRTEFRHIGETDQRVSTADTPQIATARPSSAPWTVSIRW